VVLAIIAFVIIRVREFRREAAGKGGAHRAESPERLGR